MKLLAASVITLGFSLNSFIRAPVTLLAQEAPNPMALQLQMRAHHLMYLSTLWVLSFSNILSYMRSAIMVALQ